MKNKFFVLMVLIFILIIIAVSVVMFLRISPGSQDNIISVNTPSNSLEPTFENYRYVETSDKFSYITYNELVNTSGEESYYNDDTGIIEIDDKQFKNINSISSSQSTSSLNLTNVKCIQNEKIECSIDSFTNRPRQAILFDNDVEIIPITVFLSDETKYVYYPYNNEIYYINVMNCEPDEERIVYRNGLTVYRNTGIIKYKNKIIEPTIDDDYAKQDFKNLFDCYFLFEPNDKLSVYKAYNITNWNNTISLVSYDGQIRNMLIRTGTDSSVDICYLPISLQGNVNNYNDIFYLDNKETNEKLLLYTNDEFKILELNK